MKISSNGEEITKRFFLAIDILKAEKRIRGLQTFTRMYNINYWNMMTLRNEPDKRVLKPEYLYLLVVDFGISANWLITGEGDFYERASD